MTMLDIILVFSAVYTAIGLVVYILWPEDVEGVTKRGQRVMCFWWPVAAFIFFVYMLYCTVLELRDFYNHIMGVDDEDNP
jgi:hypothetical protein